MALRMKRRGIVHTTQTSPYQCKDTGHDTFGYETHITCHEDNKDSNGWIIDNRKIQAIVEEIFNSTTGGDSCETIVCCLGKAIHQAAKDAGVLVNDVYVHLWPIAGSTPVDPDKMASFEYSLSGRFL